MSKETGINLDLEVTPVFEKNFDSVKKIVINRGGTRSSKTVSVMQLAVLFLFTGHVQEGKTVDKGVWSTVRKYSSTLDKTVIRDFEELLTKHNLWPYIKHNKTAKTYEHKSYIVEFIGADDEQKIRGSKRTVLHCNEGNELLHEDWKQLIFRTTHKAYIDFNPDDENIWINQDLELVRQHTKGDVEVVVSNYLSNTFLEQSIIDEIEYLKDTDETFWKVFGLGEYGSLRGLIFDWEVKPMPEERTLIGYGLDFGFTNDPTALTAVYKSDGHLYVDELIYERNMTNTDISDRFAVLGISKTSEIIADSAEPKSIEELSRLGWNVYPAKKGPDSIKNGIDILKRYTVYMTPESTNIIKEKKTYKWLEDKNGVTLNKPVDYNNHALDGIRYLGLNKLSFDYEFHVA
jgi:phage terminase large subunit